MNNAPPAGPSSTEVELGPLLERMYRRRFSEIDRAEMALVWGVLVRDFFQSRIDPAETVLDFGAGTCAFINEVRAARRIAVDANPELPKLAGPGVETIVTDDLSLSEVPAGSIGHVFVSNFLEHLEDHIAVLKFLGAVHRVLKPGGSILVLQPNFRLEPRRYFDFLDHRVILTDASLREALEVAGFEVAEMRARFLPFTSKSRVPKWAWAVRLYLRLPPAQWLLGRQTFARAVKLPG